MISSVTHHTASGASKIGSYHREGNTTMTIKPLGDRVLVKAIEEEEQVRGGIIIPDTAREKPQQGEIIAVGPGKVTEDGKVLPMHVKEGDTILFGKYAGTEIKIEGDEIMIMHENDILGIVEK